MKRRYIKTIIGLSIALFTMGSLDSCKVRDDFPEFGEPVEEEPEEDIIPPDNQMTPMIQSIKDKTTYLKVFQMDTTQTISPGVEYLHARFINREDVPVSIHIMELDISNPKLTMQALTPYNENMFAVQNLPEMVKFNQKTAEGKLLAAINGDAVTSGEPTGSFVKFGKVLKTNTSRTRPYIGVKKGSDVIQFFNSPDVAKYPTTAINLAEIKHLIGGSYFLLYNGDDVSTSSSGAARIAVGINQASTKLYLMAADGVIANFSAGVALNDLRDMMRAIGCYTAMQPTSGNLTAMTVLDVLNPEQSWINKNFTSTPTGTTNGIGFVLK